MKEGSHKDQILWFYVFEMFRIGKSIIKTENILVARAVAPGENGERVWVSFKDDVIVLKLIVLTAAWLWIH